MKIGIDARFYGIAGPGRYVSNLIKELEILDKENEYIIFLTKNGSELYRPQNPNFKKWVADYEWYSFSEQTFFLLDLFRARLDLLHVPHFNVPVLYTKKMVVTVHDLIMHDFDTKEATNLPLPYFMFKQVVYKFVANWAVFKAKKIFVPTETVKSELLQKLKTAKESKIIVTTEGVDQSLVALAPRDEGVLRTRLEEMGVKSTYLLYVGSAYPHKNLRTLIISFKDFLEESIEKVQLVIAGKIDKFSQRIAGFAHALKLDNSVIFAAKYSENMIVPDKDLAYLYKGALAYICPSLKEGFSITPLEAQAFGIPVLLSDIPTHKEVFGDSVLYFNPESNVDINEKIAMILNDKNLREKISKLGTENIKRYSWRSMAEKTFQGYQEA